MGEEVQVGRDETAQLPQWRDLSAAFAILTSLPLPRPQPQSAACARATLFFPLVSLTLGVTLAVPSRLLAAALPGTLCGALLVAAWAVAARDWDGGGNRALLA